MMRLTKKADYGLMAVKHLAVLGGMQACSAKDIAEAYRLPPEALAKILQRLVKAGLLLSHQGTNGGYALARGADSISVFEVVRAIDGPVFVTSCSAEADDCGVSARCTIKEPMRHVNDKIRSVLDGIKISDLYERAAAHEDPAVAQQDLVVLG